MTEELENRMRRALRPVDAPEGLADRILAALPARAAPATVTTLVPPPAARPARSGWRHAMPAALAASFVGAILLGVVAADRRDEIVAARDAEGEAASRALMDALRVTSQKLDLAYQAVNPPPAPATDEENRT